MASDLLKSAYEIAREERIKRNALVMQSLGLGLGEEDEQTEHNNAALTTTKPRAPKQEPTRQSKRVRGLGPDGEELAKVKQKAAELVNDDAMQQRIARLKSLHTERQSGYQNPTATYEHTWMRVRTMSDKALLNRVKVIESRAGQHCLVKLRMFAEVLLLADKEELAQAASEALDRLVLESSA